MSVCLVKTGEMTWWKSTGPQQCGCWMSLL